jgi:hypothetical protein
MIALVVYACLASQPDTCSQTVVQWSPTPQELGCAAQMPAPVTAWATANPDQTVQDHWCRPTRIQAVAVVDDPRVLPLGACDVRSRATAIVWSYRHPGVVAAEACKRLISN